ncbi:MAG TPA: alkylated DNA repair protein, partial [Roseiarcus sp.]|nr:alkylated DNA repair protein [Roseiarcus sp.]
MTARIALALAAALVAAAAAVAWFVTPPRAVSAEVAAAASEPGDPEAGKDVFYIAGCESCHMSPDQKDPLRLGGGLELKTPFGSFYPP